jgi:hypothetical protein
MNISATLSGETRSSQPLWFKAPPEIHEIDLAEDPEVRVRRAYANATAIMRGSTEEQRVYLVYTQEMMVRSLVAEGALWAGSLLVRSDADPSRLAAAQYALSVREAELEAHQPLAAVADGLREPGREVVFSKYPAGKALVVAEQDRVTLPVSVTGTVVENTHVVRQAQVIFACPDQEHLAILSLSTESVDDWETYLDILNTMADSVSFREPHAKSSIANRLAGF